MLERDIHKNKPLLWLTRKLLLIMKEKDKGLFVGSVISKDLANYYMSYLYHYAESELTVTRRSMYRSRMCAGIRKCNTRTGRFREENGG